MNDRREYGSGVQAQSKARRKPKCHFCDKPFIPTRRNQKYCNKACCDDASAARKEALIEALARYFECYGLKRQHVEECVELWMRRCKSVAESLGFEYDERRKKWYNNNSAQVLSAPRAV